MKKIRIRQGSFADKAESILSGLGLMGIWAALIAIYTILA